MKFKPVFTAVQSQYDAKLEADLNYYEDRYGYRSMRIRPVIERKGWIAAIEQTVSKNKDSSSFEKLIELKLEHMAWEVFVLAHTELFSDKCVRNAHVRMTPQVDDVPAHAWSSFS